MYKNYAPVLKKIKENFTVKNNTAENIYNNSMSEQLKVFSKKRLAIIKSKIFSFKKEIIKNKSNNIENTRLNIVNFPIGIKINDKNYRNRESYIRLLIDKDILKSDRIIKALLKFDILDFLHSSNHKKPYREKPVIDQYTNTLISAPLFIYALVFESLELKQSDTYLEVETESGFGAALAADIVGKEGKVISTNIKNKNTHSLEYILRKKTGNINIEVKNFDGTTTLPNNLNINKMWIKTAMPEIPRELKTNLKENSRLIVPVGPMYSMQSLNLYYKKNNKILNNYLTKCFMPPTVGINGWKKEL